MSKKTKQLIDTSRMYSQAKKGLGRFFSNNSFVILAFVLPFLIMLLNFAIKRFAPFGDQQILVVDLWHQYYPFLVDFQDKIISGQSLLHSWTNGMGGNYLALLSYYVASPINFLTAFVPASFLREFLMLSVCVEVGCAGGFTAIFLKKTFHKNGLPLVFFSVGYGCCAFFGLLLECYLAKYSSYATTCSTWYGNAMERKQVLSIYNFPCLISNC